MWSRYELAVGAVAGITTGVVLAILAIQLYKTAQVTGAI